MAEKKPHKPKPSATSGPTKQTAFRLSDETIAELDELVLLLGLSSRADALRLAVRKLHRAEKREAGQ